MSAGRLLGLVLVFAPLSLISFGGGQAIVAEMQHQTVHVQGWLSDREFTDLFAISRAAPGPSTLISALIGWQVAGWWGAVVAALAIYIPSSLVVYAATRWWHARQDSPWRAALERGLTPIAVGLLFAGAWAVLEAAHVNLIQVLTMLAAAALFITNRAGPYAVMAIAAVGYALLGVV